MLHCNVVICITLVRITGAAKANMTKRLPAFLLVLAILGAAGGYWIWRGAQDAGPPEGFVYANGRVELQRFVVSAKMAGRLLTVTPREGDLVEAGAVVATQDTEQLDAKSQAAIANAAAAREAESRVAAEVRARRAALALAQVETRRADQLVGDEAVSPADADRRRTQRDAAVAALAGAQAAQAQAAAMVQAAEAQLSEVRSAIGDARLRAPAAGRVEYRLLEPGEMVGPGSRVLTLLDPLDAYMTVFIPTREVAQLRIGAEARLKLDAASPLVAPARVAFIAADAQFTPRTVETASERDKLMYRVKLAIDRDWLAAHRDGVHGGLTGVAYVRRDAKAPWPADLRLSDGR